MLIGCSAITFNGKTKDSPILSRQIFSLCKPGLKSFTNSTNNSNKVGK